MTSVAVTRSRLPPAWIEAALTVVLYAAYDGTRALRRGSTVVADRNGRALLRWETAAHLTPEHALNQLLWHAPVLAVAAAYYYATLHFVVTPVVLIWLYRKHPARYLTSRTVLMVSTGIALVGFWLFPTAPPRLLPDSGIRDTLADVHQWGWWSGQASAPRGLSGLANEYAAMPSLHIVWSLWAGTLIACLAGSRAVRLLGLGYPFATAIVVMGTGNHYLLDVVAGAALLAVCTTLPLHTPESRTPEEKT